MGRRKQQVVAPVQPRPPPDLTQEDDDSMDVDVVYVKLKSSDGKYFNFTESEASCSNALKRMLESARNCTNNHAASHNEPNGRTDHIPLPSIDSKVLANILQWCKMHSYNQSSVASRADVSGHSESNMRLTNEDEQTADERPQVAITWDMKYLASFSELDLLKLTTAANFLDIQDLYDSCCRFMANKWENMKVDEIRRAYNIRDDFAAEEEIQLIQENKRIGLTE